MKKIRIAGVHEHFNMPWHLGIEDNTFLDAGFDVEWIDVPEGSGKMCQMLENNEVDFIIVLTEAIVKFLHQKPIGKIIQTYVESPLNWGLHVAYNSQFKQVEDLQNQTIAISRLGSGSHLMSYVLAEHQQWDLDTLNFEIINNLDGAVKALTNDTSQLFLWEQWTTKPLVDQKIFRRIGTLPTPWPCFVIAASDHFLEENKNHLDLLLNKINIITEEFKMIPSIERTIAERYQLNIEDVKDWLSTTEWSQSQLSKKQLNNVINYLFTLNLIENKTPLNQLILN